MKTYPTTVSRTLDPSGKALVTIVGQHDRQITDADINLIQDLQDQKRTALLEGVTSGCMSYAPMKFNPFSPNTFFIPAFDVLFNGERISVAGNLSADLGVNRVILPPPAFWATGTADEDARTYVVFLEFWYQALDSTSGAGYYTDPQTQLRYYFPNGGVNPDPSNATSVPNDSIDPFQGLLTTQRAQIQWRISVQRVPLGYNFAKNAFGLSFDPVAGGNQVQAQAGQAATIPGTTYQFVNMASINGDAGVWRAGTNQPNVNASALGTMDGFSYAMPLAVVFQRNTGPFDVVNNLFGCADPAVPGSGLLASRTSGRFDFKLADQIFSDDVVDTRLTVKLDGWDNDKLMREAFGDLVMGNCRFAIGRGESPGNKTEALGSTLSYNVAMSPTAVGNVNTVGRWNPLTISGVVANMGFANGFSADQRTFFTAFTVSTSQKSVGVLGARWAVNDAFTVSIPTASQAIIQSLTVTALVTNQATNTKTAAALLQGQVQINIGATSATVIFINDLSNTAFDPGTNPLSIVIGVQQAAGTGIDLRKIPFAVNGGVLQDAVSGKKLPVFGVSEYVVQAPQPALAAANVWAINPEYSDTLFGTKVWLTIAGNDPSISSQTINGAVLTSVVLNRIGINGSLTGLYVTRAWDLATGNFYSISGRIINGNTHILQIAGAVPSTSTLVVSFLAQNTAQLAFNAPVKAITHVEETVLVGNFNTNPSFPMDNRVSVVSVGFDPTANASTILLVANGGTLQGVSGDDVNKFIWVLDSSGNLNATLISRASISPGYMSITVPTQNLTTSKFFMVAAINPSFDANSSLLVEVQYIPYQGEGVDSRNYEFVEAEDNALITSNGTGAAPVAGLTDVYPYNRELPIASSLPAQLAWNDATLVNAPLASFFDSNFVAMRVNNVEHTFLAPLHTNDFIPPINRDIRKIVQFNTPGARGFAKALPHIGFAIAPPTPRTVLGQNLQSTLAPITLYVNNLNGNDALSGLDLLNAKKTVGAALAALPPVLRHPCVIILVATGLPFTISSLQASLNVIALGDGDIRSAKQYALGNLSRVIQDAGRLVISRQAGATSTVVIDATGFNGFGDGPTSAFYCDTTRVILNGLQFVGFTNPAITAYNSDIDFVDCVWVNNVQAGAYIGCDAVILDRGATTIPNAGIGHVCTQSNLTSSQHALTIASGALNPGAFYVGSRNSTLNLRTHGTTTLEETNIFGPTIIAQVELNSSISVTGGFQSQGTAVLNAQSALSRSVLIEPFLGGVTKDSSSNIVTQLG